MKQVADHQDFIVEELKRDKKFADIFVSETVKEYEENQNIELMLSSFDNYTRAFGLDKLIKELEKLNCKFNLLPIIKSIGHDDNQTLHNS